MPSFAEFERFAERGVVAYPALQQQIDEAVSHLCTEIAKAAPIFELAAQRLSEACRESAIEFGKFQLAQVQTDAHEAD